jgi:hypothetical protein
MAVTGKNARNERLKLFAAFLNAFAVAILGAGGLLPALSHYFGIGAPIGHPEWLLSLFWLCLATSAGTHLLAQLILGGVVD